MVWLSGNPSGELVREVTSRGKNSSWRHEKGTKNAQFYRVRVCPYSAERSVFCRFYFKNNCSALRLQLQGLPGMTGDGCFHLDSFITKPHLPDFNQATRQHIKPTMRFKNIIFTCCYAKKKKKSLKSPPGVDHVSHLDKHDSANFEHVLLVRKHPGEHPVWETALEGNRGAYLALTLCLTQ